MAAEKKRVSGSQVICYQSGGAGVPVVLLHGFAEDHTVWEKQSPALERSYCVIIPDLPGSGRSTPLQDYSMDSLAKNVSSILDHESITKCILIGHSMGGYISLAFAEQFPGRLLALGLFSSTAYPDTEEKKANRRKSIEFIRQQGVRKFLEQTGPNLFSETTKKQHPEMIQELVNRYSGFAPDVLISYYEAMIQRPDRTAVLKDSSVPVLFVIGEQDTVIPAEQMLQQAHLPLISHIEILKYSGHMGMWEEADKATEIMMKFCASL